MERKANLYMDIKKAGNASTPVEQFFVRSEFDALVQSRIRYTSVASGPWSQTYYTEKPSFSTVDIREFHGSSSETTINQRNVTGTQIDNTVGGIAPMAGASSMVDLIVQSNHFTVSPAEVHGRKSITPKVGVTLNPESRDIASMSDLYSERLAGLVDKMQEERDWQMLNVLARGTMPSCSRPDTVLVNWNKLQRGQVGSYEFPKMTKRDSGSVSCIIAAMLHLERAARSYTSGTPEYMLLCNSEFLFELLSDSKLAGAFQYLPTDINPLFTGNFLTLKASLTGIGGGRISIVQDNIDFVQVARKSDGKLEEIQSTGLPRMATTGSAAEKLMAKPAKPAARLVCISPSQFIQVIGVVHGFEGPQRGQRVSLDTSSFNSIVRCCVEYSWLPVSLLPFLAMDITIATDDTTVGVGKLKKIPSVFNSNE